MASGSNEIKTYFGRCRCCLNYGYLKNMWEEHDWQGDKEIYVEMLLHCFALSWEQNKESMEHDQICEACIIRLRDANQFKKMILESQEELLNQIEEDCELPVKIENADFSVKRDSVDEATATTSVYIDDPDDPDYVFDDDPAEYQEVEYLEDEDNKEGDNSQQTSQPAKRTKRPAQTEPDRKWPRKLPKAERYKTYKQYTEEDLRKCMEAYRNDELTAQEASDKFNIPRKTILAKAKMDAKDTRWDNIEVAEEIPTKIPSRAVLFRFKDNVRHILENSNATPIKGHWGIGYGCSYCNYQNPKTSKLKRHTLDLHLDVYDALKVKSYGDLIIKLDITDLKCKLCGENFDFLNKFIDHLSNFHGIEMFSDTTNHIIPFKFDSEYLRCALCAKQYDNFKHLTEHMNEHYRNYSCDICGRGFINKRSLKTHLTRHQTGVYICSYCSKVFDTRIKMKEHERVLHIRASKTRKCGYCDEKFADPVRKTCHEVSVHGAPTPSYECKACGKKYDSQRALRTHTNQYHLMLKPHTCADCGKGFYYKNELKRHVVKHTGVRDFQCEVCFKWYSTRKSLAVHMKIHLDDRQYNCERCGRGFVQKANWLHHMRSKHGEGVAVCISG